MRPTPPAKGIVMAVSRHARAARWVGAVLVGFAPIPLLAAGAAANETGTPALTATARAAGNNGTLKVHEEGTPVGTENNDPKVCVFNLEGFGFDVGQTGYIVLDPQGGVGGPMSYGPVPWGPADSTGFGASDYFNSGSGIQVADGMYKATLYGKQLPSGQLADQKAKSKVFKVNCASPSPSESSTSPSETSSSSSAPATSTSASSSSAPATSTSASSSSAPASSTSASTSAQVNPTKHHSSGPGVTVLPTRVTAAPGVLPHTGSDFPTGAALALSVLLMGLGATLIAGPGRWIRFEQRRH